MTEEEFKRGQVRVTAEKWHYRVYQWWQSRGGGLSYGFREHLCHYMRVVLIWVPLMWFFLEPVYKWVRPWMITLATLFLLSVAACFYLFPEISLRVAIILAGTMIVFAILFGLVLKGIELCERNRDLLDTILKWGTSPVWVPLFLLFVVFSWTIDNVLLPWFNFGAKLTNWFFFKSYLGFLYLWMLIPLVALVAESWYFGLDIGLYTIAAIVGIVFVVAVGVFLVKLVLKFFEIKREEAQLLREFNPKPQGTGFWIILWRFLKAKKAKICPYIILPTDRQ